MYVRIKSKFINKNKMIESKEISIITSPFEPNGSKCCFFDNSSLGLRYDIFFLSFVVS